MKWKSSNDTSLFRLFHSYSPKEVATGLRVLRKEQNMTTQGLLEVFEAGRADLGEGEGGFTAMPTKRLPSYCCCHFCF